MWILRANVPAGCLRIESVEIWQQVTVRYSTVFSLSVGSHSTLKELGKKTQRKKRQDHGKGLIPKDRIMSQDRMPGIPNSVSSITVKHKSGKNSRLWFKSYEQGKEQWMGKAVDIVWLDEEPPQDIYSHHFLTVKY